MNTKGKTIPFISDERHSAITDCLSDLRLELSAACILLADISGQLITKTGVTEGLDVANLISLLAGGFATTFEMSNYLGEKKAMNLNYHEGESYDIYAANVGDNLILTLIFERRIQMSRIGMVWLYTKRTISDLLEIIATPDNVEGIQVIGEDFSTSLRDELDSVFDQ